MLLYIALALISMEIANGSVVVQNSPLIRVKQQLGVTFDTTSLNVPGLYLPLSVPLFMPSLAIPTQTHNGSFTVLMVDPNGSKPYFLHWLQTNLTISPETSPGQQKATLINSTPATVPYLNPQPPPGTGRHRYIELLFRQPANFVFPESFAKIVHPRNVTDRAKFNLTAFTAAAGFDAPIAGNFFFAENVTANPSSTSGVGFSPARTVEPFTGRALRATMDWPSVVVLTLTCAICIASFF